MEFSLQTKSVIHRSGGAYQGSAENNSEAYTGIYFNSNSIGTYKHGALNN